MARLGIDFGTTNTVAVVADRGQLPIVLHRVATSAGEVVQELYPSIVWHRASAGEWMFGPEADRRCSFRLGRTNRPSDPNLRSSRVRCMAAARRS